LNVDEDNQLQGETGNILKHVRNGEQLGGPMIPTISEVGEQEVKKETTKSPDTIAGIEQYDDCGRLPSDPCLG
ncbi:hypothetical protein ACJMK2_041667, partial [Sinanodonta woodiana]